ncbi:hypothetical protein O7632_07930 [Solwaraspora sp. WMMD406]|uniref:hypothetical protein n=1 Tax=Solwaraspora sp. WMMD406 TaxID=3016095 RepID=UPI00241643F0|nr:hypothetical protein [Solwaraspora sp. WMMD406]MDG4764033.1 hypothetical protein [Solwaraspora sp. WMMD406]
MATIRRQSGPGNDGPARPVAARPVAARPVVSSVVAVLAVLALTGCTGIGIGEAPESGTATYSAWGLNEASSALTGSDRMIVLNGDIQRDDREFFQVSGVWGQDGFTLDEPSADQVRALVGQLPDRTGDPDCHRLVLVNHGFFGSGAIAVVDPAEFPPGTPVIAHPLR